MFFHFVKFIASKLSYKMSKILFIEIFRSYFVIFFEDTCKIIVHNSDNRIGITKKWLVLNRIM